jgi:Got1/Sft2-like family
MNNIYSKLQNIESLFVPEQRPKEWYEELEERICSVFPSMTYQQRIGGCLMFMVVGFLISMGSTMRLLTLLEGNPVPFATMYTTGNIISICATCFLYGPWTQAKKMFAPTRAIATFVYLTFMSLTMFLAFFKGVLAYRVLLLMICILCQFLALCWYTISFIPFARDIVLSCIKETCCRSCALPTCCEDQEAPNDFWG